MHCVISRPLTRQDHRAGGSMKERPDPWLISSCGLREKQRKATQVTFRQVSVGRTSPGRSGEVQVGSLRLCLFNYTPLCFIRNMEAMFPLRPQPLPGNPAALHNTWIAGSCGHQTLKSVLRCIIKCLFKFTGSPDSLSSPSTVLWEWKGNNGFIAQKSSHLHIFIMSSMNDFN